MKIIFIALALLATCDLRANGETRTRFMLPDDIAAAFEKAYVGESNMIEGPRGIRRILMNYMKDHWRELIDNIHDVAPTRIKRLIFYRAAEDLSPNEFLLYLERIVELRDKNMIDDDELGRCMAFSYYKSQFLEINIDHPRVQRIYIKRNEAYRQSNPSLEPFDVKKIPEIKQNGIEFRTMAEGTRTLRSIELRGSFRDEKARGGKLGPEESGKNSSTDKGVRDHGKFGLSNSQWSFLLIGGLAPLVLLALALLIRKKPSRP